MVGEKVKGGIRVIVKGGKNVSLTFSPFHDL
jgi:hypothetical protein